MRRIFRIQTRRADHTDNLAGFVVIYANSAAASIQSLIGGFADVCIDRQCQIISVSGNAVGSCQHVITYNTAFKSASRRGRDVSVHITDSVNSGSSDEFIVIVFDLAVFVFR